MRNIIASICLVLTCVVPACAGQGDSKLQKGNHLYHQKKFPEATQWYSDAVALDPNRALYRFNLGDGYYKTGNYPAAAQSFEQALATSDKKLEQKAAYNLGNAEFQWGLTQENKDINKAIELVERSIRHYKRSLVIDDKDKDAKVNLAIAEEKLKELKEKKKNQPRQSQQQKQEQNKQQDQQGQQNSSQQEKNQQNSSASENKEQNKESNSQENKSGGNKEERTGAGQEKQEKESGEQKQGGSAGQAPEHMSGQEARMLLDGYRQEERMFGTIDDTRKSQTEQVSKDW